MGDQDGEYGSLQQQTINLLASEVDHDILNATIGEIGLSEVVKTHNIPETYVSDTLQEFEEYGLIRMDRTGIQALPGAYLLADKHQDHDDTYFEALDEYVGNELFANAYQRGKKLAQYANSRLPDLTGRQDALVEKLRRDLNTVEDLEIAEAVTTILRDGGTKSGIAEELDYAPNTINARYEILEDAGVVSRIDGTYQYEVADNSDQILTALRSAIEPDADNEQDVETFSEKEWDAVQAASTVFGQGGSMGDFQEALDVSYPTAKKRRDRLEELGLVHTEKRGTYEITDQMRSVLEQHEDSHDIDMSALTYRSVSSDKDFQDENNPRGTDVTDLIETAKTQDTTGIDIDELVEALQNEYTQKVFAAGTQVLSEDTGSKRQLVDAAGVSRTAVDRRYSQLEQLGVFQSEGTSSSTRYSVHPYAAVLGELIEHGGTDTMFDVLAEEASFPIYFGSKDDWNIFTTLVESFRRGEDLKTASEQADTSYANIMQTYKQFKRDGFFSRDGPNYNPRYSVLTDALIEQEFINDTEKATLPGLSQYGQETAAQLQRFVDGHRLANQEFREHWDVNELPENLIIPQWQELLASARASALWDGTLSDATTWLDVDEYALEKRLDRLPDEAVVIHDGDEDTSKRHRNVTIDPRFKTVFESFNDRLLFDPDDVSYTPAQTDDNTEEEEKDSKSVTPVFRDYSQID